MWRLYREPNMGSLLRESNSHKNDRGAREKFSKMVLWVWLSLFLSQVKGRQGSLHLKF